MNLEDAIDKLSDLSDDEHLFVANESPLTPKSIVYVGEFDEDENAPPQAIELREFMDIWQVKEVIAGKKQLAQENGTWDTKRKVEALLEYISNDE